MKNGAYPAYKGEGSDWKEQECVRFGEALCGEKMGIIKAGKDDDAA
jgi:hypothetical protein